MKDNFIVTVIHRPELSPEYVKNSGGDTSDVEKKQIEIFNFQQDAAHNAGLKTTIQITYASLFVDSIIEVAKYHHDKYQDEIGLSLLGLPCEEFKEKYHTDDFCIWQFSKEDKMKIIDDVFGKFYEKFGFYPESTGSYFLDSFTLNYIHKNYPSVKCAIATCFEEGPKAYHTCNNSWYTFMDGGPWNPWIPSKVNSHCPAFSKDDDCGIVAIPHLSRDLMACFDGNGSNFGTHPQNVLRGMIYYKDETGYHYPYLYNLIDEYRHLGKYNNGYSYNMMFVGPGWLNKKGRWECNYELLAKSYIDAMNYYGKLKNEGKLTDMTMSEFATYYRDNHPDYMESENGLWKDILYGSNKQQFWYIDPFFRCCLDFNQGGAMVDLRPYVARIPQDVGIGTKNVYDASYPYLIQANYRAGFFTHYAGAGTIESCKVSYNGKSTDLALCRTMAKFSKDSDGNVILTANPVNVRLDDLNIDIVSKFTFIKGKGILKIERNVLNNPNNLSFELKEYITAGYSTNEYQSDLTTVKLIADNKQIDYSYKGRIIEGTKSSKVVIPDIDTIIELTGNGEKFIAEEGIAFSPCFRLAQEKTLKEGSLVTCLKLAKEN